VPQLGEIILHD